MPMCKAPPREEWGLLRPELYRCGKEKDHAGECIFESPAIRREHERREPERREPTSQA